MIAKLVLSKGLPILLLVLTAIFIWIQLGGPRRWWDWVRNTEPAMEKLPKRRVLTRREVTFVWLFFIWLAGLVIALIYL